MKNIEQVFGDKEEMLADLVKDLTNSAENVKA